MTDKITSDIETSDVLGGVVNEGDAAQVAAQVNQIAHGVAVKALGWGNRDDRGGNTRQTTLNFAKGDSGSSDDADWANVGRFE